MRWRWRRKFFLSADHLALGVIPDAAAAAQALRYPVLPKSQGGDFGKDIASKKSPDFFETQTPVLLRLLAS